MATRDEMEALIAKLERAIQKHETTLVQLRTALDSARNMLPMSELLDEDDSAQIVLPMISSSKTPVDSTRYTSSDLTRENTKKKRSLRGAIIETINDQTGSFSVADITSAITVRYPGQFSNAQKGSVSSIISKIAKDKYIRQIEPGAGSRAPRYVRMRR